MNPQHISRLNNNAVLPVWFGGRKYETTDHYVYASFLNDNDLILSYPVDKARHAFHYQDQELFQRVIYEACNKFNEKKCRSLQRQGDKTIGSLVRDFLKKHQSFLYKTNHDPFPTVMGAASVENVLYGYDLVGHSLDRTKYMVEKIPILTSILEEHIFWKTHPEKENIPPLLSPKTYRAILPSQKKPDHIPTSDETNAIPFYEMGENDEEYEEETEEQGYNPEETIPVYSNDRVRWIPTHPNTRLDDMREVGARADFLYSTDAPMSDPFHLPDNPYSRLDPVSIFKIYKATEHLVERMKNGMDILVFLHKPVDAILWECKVVIGENQRHQIYVEYWNQFLSKTIPFYHFIEKELMHPQNLAGFIRQEYAIDLNERIGNKIRDIMFVSFLYQVMERYYPQVAPELRFLALTREKANFSEKEYYDLTDRLYHLFFQGKFLLDEEGTHRVLTHESYRLTEQDIEHAIQFVPCKITATPTTDIQDTPLDPMFPVDITIDNKVFHDMFQYIFYKLFQQYGTLTQKEAYELLSYQDTLMKGNDPRLTKKLTEVIEVRKKKLLLQAYTIKYEQHPHVQEIVLYSQATNQPIPEELWNQIPIHPADLLLMKWVVSIIPATSKHHFEKSVRLYAFLHELVRSLDLMKSIVGKRLQKKQLNVFFQCFYHKLKTIQQGLKVPNKQMPQEFVDYITSTKTIHEDNLPDLWRMVFPMVYLFQQKKFDPVSWHKEALLSTHPPHMKDLIQVLSQIIQCLYPGQEVPNDHFYLITQILSGKDHIPMWPDPSFELIQEVEENDGSMAHLPEEIRRRMPKKKATNKKWETFHYNILHPSLEGLQKQIQYAFQRPSPYDPVVSRASYALAALRKELTQPGRITFYM